MAAIALSDSQTSSADSRSSQQRRTGARRTASAYIGVRAGDSGNFEARLLDLSQHGCSLKTGDKPIRLGQILTLNMLDRETITGVVRWTRDGRTGIEFFRPFDLSLMNHAA